MTLVPPYTLSFLRLRSDEHPTGRNVSLPREGPELMQLLDIQGYSYERRDALIPLLSRILVNCGGWVHDRHSISASSFEIELEIELRFILDLYAGLIASGLELTRSNHLALTDLCTCRKHFLGTSDARQIVSIRIEIAFLQEQTLHTLLMTGSSLA